MDMKLSNNELRVIGSLIEKEITTPDQYPLSLNALINACDQKSNRDPVMSLDESTVQKTLDELSKRHLVVEKSPFGGRTSKYQHRFCNTEFSDFQFTNKELGILCVLFLRGPQTPGELRTRTNRLCEFADVNEVEDTLENLTSHKDGPFVKKLPRQPGKRESRYVHLFCDTVITDEQQFDVVSGDDTAVMVNYDRRIQYLEDEILDLRSELDALKEIITQLTKG